LASTHCTERVNKSYGHWALSTRANVSNTTVSRPFIICNVSRRTSVTILRKSVICISFRMYSVSSVTYQLRETVPSLNEFSPRAFSSIHAAPFRPSEFSRTCLLRAAPRRIKIFRIRATIKPGQNYDRQRRHRNHNAAK